MTSRIDIAALESSLQRLAGSGGDPVLTGSLQRVVDATAELFDVDGGGLMVADEHGDLRYAVAPPGRSRELETAQLDAGEGPCVDAYLDDAVVLTADLTSDPRWPRIADRATQLGIHGVLGLPIHVRGMTIGSLDLFTARRHEFGEVEVIALQRYAAVVEDLLYAAISAEAAGALADQLTFALEHRVVIERAVGFLMARRDTDQRAAFAHLRATARSRRLPIGAVAQDLLHHGRLSDEPYHDPSSGRPTT